MSLARIQVRRGTSAQWAAANPILALGEPGLDTTLQGTKYGDGVTPWATLPWPQPICTPWTTLTLTNSWVPYNASYTPQYRKVGDNVQIRGLMKDGANASPFTMPAGFRPAYPEETFMVFASNALGGLSIANNGAAAIQVPTGTGAGKYIYLSGIIFSTVP